MTYNIHPLFVHFPIALLCVYSIIKIVPVRRLFPSVSWKDIEGTLLVFGVIGAFSALLTGETAEHLVKPNHALVEAHSLFANITTYAYLALLVGYLASYINSNNGFGERWVFLGGVSRFLEKVLYNRIFSIILTLIALCALLVTGILGGVMVYGLSADPIAPFVLKILNITI